MKNIIAPISAMAIVIALAALLSLLMSWPTWMLWNGCLVGAVDGVREVTWLQAWGLQFLCSMLFKTTLNTKRD
jgi:hypothetical protein